MTYADEVNTDSPILYWKLDETSGTTFTDETANGWDGAVVNGTPTLQQSSIVTDGTYSLGLDGSSSIGRTTNTDDLDTMLSMECWVRTTDNAKGYILHLTLSSSTGVEFFTVWMNSDGTIEGEVYNGTAVGPSTETINDGDPHHLVMQYESGTTKIYLDGSEVASASTSAINGLANRLYVGAQGTASQYFTGDVDEVALYDAVLSTTRITAHYDAGVSAGDATFTANVGDATAGGAATSLTGGGTFTATVGDATAGGASTSFTGDATFTATVGDATAGGNPVAMAGEAGGDATFAANVGDATAGGGTVSMAGTATFTTSVGDATAGGRTVVMFTGVRTTPAARTITVPSEGRSVTVPAEDRTVAVPADDRTIAVPAA